MVTARLRYAVPARRRRDRRGRAGRRAAPGAEPDASGSARPPGSASPGPSCRPAQPTGPASCPPSLGSRSSRAPTSGRRLSALRLVGSTAPSTRPFPSYGWCADYTDRADHPSGKGRAVAAGDRQTTDARLRATLAAVAPGTELREGLERILRGRTGALVVLGQDKVVDSICTGGFLLDVEFTPTGLRELAKMDGAIVCDRDATRIIRAGVHLMPDADHRHPGDRHPAPHRRPGGPADRLPRHLRLAVDAHHRAVRQRRALRPRGQRRDLVSRQPGPRHPRALQAPPRRGLRHAVGPRDRGPRHGSRRRLGRPAARDGAADRQRDRGVRARARQRRPAARPAARRAGRRRRRRPPAGHPRLRAGRPQGAVRPRT